MTFIQYLIYEAGRAIRAQGGPQTKDNHLKYTHPPPPRPKIRDILVNKKIEEAKRKEKKKNDDEDSFFFPSSSITTKKMRRRRRKKERTKGTINNIYEYYI